MVASRQTHGLFATTSLLIVGLIGWQGEAIAAVFLPVLRWAIGVFCHRYELLNLSIRTGGGDVVFFAQLNIRSDWVFKSATLPADTVIEVSTLVAHLLLDVALLSITALGLGIYRRGSRLALATLFGFCVLTLTVLDVPIVLIGAANDCVLADFAPELKQVDFFALGMRLLNHGGRILLAVGLPLLLAQTLRTPGAQITGSRMPGSRIPSSRMPDSDSASLSAE